MAEEVLEGHAEDWANDEGDLAQDGEPPALKRTKTRAGKSIARVVNFEDEGGDEMEDSSEVEELQPGDILEVLEGWYPGDRPKQKQVAFAAAKYLTALLPKPKPRTKKETSSK